MGCAPSIHISETQTVYPGAREAEAAPGPAAPLPPPGGPGAPLRPEPEALAATSGALPAEPPQPRDSKVRAPGGRAGGRERSLRAGRGRLWVTDGRPQPVLPGRRPGPGPQGRVVWGEDASEPWRRFWGDTRRPDPGVLWELLEGAGGRSLPPERDGEPPEPGRSELGSRGREGEGRGRRALHPPSCWAPRALLLVRCVGTPYPRDPISFASLRVHWRFPSLSIHTCVYSAWNYKIRPGTPFLTHQNKVHFLKRSDWWDTLVTFFFLDFFFFF